MNLQVEIRNAIGAEGIFCVDFFTANQKTHGRGGFTSMSDAILYASRELALQAKTAKENNQ